MLGAQAADVLQASVAQHTFCNSKMVRVCVRNTFISCDFEEDGDGGSAALELGGLRESKLLGSLGCGCKFC